MDGVTSSTAELNILDGVTATAAEINSLDFALQTAENGAGAAGTGGFCRTYRYTEPNGDIVTEIQIDLTGLGAKGDLADDVIGVVTAAPDAYIGQYVVATYGVVYRVEAICLELPASTGTITTDINFTWNASGTLGYDEAASNDYLFNTGGMVAGQQLEMITPALTTTEYLYMTEGDTAANVGVYNAGQYILRFYGHAILS
jgi:hypothetical protein